MSDFGVPSLLGQLSPEEIEFLSSIGHRQIYADGEMIYEEGDPAEGMSVVVSGQVKLVKRQASGGMLLETAVNAGQSYGDVSAFITGRRIHCAMASCETVIDHFSPSAFEQMLQYPGIMRALYRIATFRLSRVVEMLDDARSLSIEARVGKLLCGMTDVEDGPGQIDCLQEDVANILGVSAMTVAKALSVLRREGLVTTGYRKILVPDTRRLRAWVAERAR